MQINLLLTDIALELHSCRQTKGDFYKLDYDIGERKQSGNNRNL